MSRKGRVPITLPKGVEVHVTGGRVLVKGAKGSFQHDLCDGVLVAVADGHVHVSTSSDTSEMRRFHGLHHSLINNMIIGASQGFEKNLEMVGVGYRAVVQGSMLCLQLGFSHPTDLPIPKGLSVKVEKNTAIAISGVDKQVVGQFAAYVRSIRPPEPYQGKGVRYAGEQVRRKAGKAAKTAKK